MNLNESSSSEQQASDHISSSAGIQPNATEVRHSAGYSAVGVGDADNQSVLSGARSIVSAVASVAQNVPEPSIPQDLLLGDAHQAATDAESVNYTSTRETPASVMTLSEAPYISMQSGDAQRAGLHIPGVSGVPGVGLAQIPLVPPNLDFYLSSSVTQQSGFMPTKPRDVIFPAGIPPVPQIPYIPQIAPQQLSASMSALPSLSTLPLIPQVADEFTESMRARPVHDSSGLVAREAYEVLGRIPERLTTSAFSPYYVDARATELGLRIDELTICQASCIVQSQVEMLLEAMGNDREITASKLHAALVALQISVPDEFAQYCQSLRPDQ